MQEQKHSHVMMKVLKLFLLGVVFVLWMMSSAFSDVLDIYFDNLNCAVVDMERVFDRYPEYQSLKSELKKSTRRLTTKKEDELLRPIANRLRQVIETLADTGGYNVVIDYSGAYSPPVLYIHDSLNLTAAVLHQLESGPKLVDTELSSRNQDTACNAAFIDLNKLLNSYSEYIKSRKIYERIRSPKERAAKEPELLNPIQTKLAAALKRVAGEKGFSVIFDSVAQSSEGMSVLFVAEDQKNLSAILERGRQIGIDTRRSTNITRDVILALRSRDGTQSKNPDKKN